MNDNMKFIKSYYKDVHLLYVEDNENVRLNTLKILQNFFDNITVAENGEEGINSFKEQDIDLIITDINMPKIGGIEMSKLVRETNITIPIIIMSAHSETPFKGQAYNAGVNEYLEKPLELPK